MESCLSSHGWDVKTTPDGGVWAEYSQEQSDRYDADREECEKTFGYDVPPTYDETQLRAMYKQVLATADCIRAKGYDPGTAPTEQTWIDQVQNGPGGWDPYHDLYPDVIAEAEYYTLIEQCPRTWN